MQEEKTTEQKNNNEKGVGQTQEINIPPTPITKQKEYTSEQVIKQPKEQKKPYEEQYISKTIAAEQVYSEINKARVISLFSLASCFIITLANRASRKFGIIITAVFCVVFVYFTWRNTNEMVRLNDTYKLGKKPIHTKDD